MQKPKLIEKKKQYLESKYSFKKNYLATSASKFFKILRL